MISSLLSIGVLEISYFSILQNNRTYEPAGEQLYQYNPNFEIISIVLQKIRFKIDAIQKC